MRQYEFFVYLLECADGSYYTGVTNNLEKRLWQHKTAYFPRCYTATRRPLILRYMEVYQLIDHAKARELQIKGWSRAKKEALIKEDWSALKAFAANYTRRFGTEQS
jgi:putative endonuclease